MRCSKTRRMRSKKSRPITSSYAVASKPYGGARRTNEGAKRKPSTSRFKPDDGGLIELVRIKEPLYPRDHIQQTGQILPVCAVTVPIELGIGAGIPFQGFHDIYRPTLGQTKVVQWFPGTTCKTFDVHRDIATGDFLLDFTWPIGLPVVHPTCVG